MKSALKFLSCSFFSEKISGEAPKRGMRYILISSLLALAFLIGGVTLAFTVPFKTHYRHSSGLRATLVKTLGDSEDKVNLFLRDGSLTADRLVDTVINKEDRERYYGGTDIVIDTRPADALDDFEAYCVSKSGAEISYEEYLSLAADVKTLYTFRIRYTGNELVIDDALKDEYKSFLNTRQGIEGKLAEVNKLAGREYDVALYELYLSEYYPSLSVYEKNGGAPKTRNYYYYNYADCKNIIFIFSDSMAGLYKTDGGIEQILYGVYTGVEDGEIGGSAKAIDSFIFACAKGSRPYIIYRSLISSLSLLPFLLCIVICIIAIAYCVYRMQKIDSYKFWEVGKIVCSYLIYTALFSAVGVVAFSFLFKREILNWVAGIIFFVILLIRTGVTVVINSVKYRKAKNQAQPLSEPTIPSPQSFSVPDGNTQAQTPEITNSEEN